MTKSVRYVSTLSTLLAVQGIAVQPAVLRAPAFSHPLRITNRYVPLASLDKDVLMGVEDGHKVRIDRTATRKTQELTVDGKAVSVLVVEDRETKDGAIDEITADYFAQGDDGSVYYLGEAVDQYRDGKVFGHDGAWIVGKKGAEPGILFPANPKLKMHFQSERVPNVTTEDVEILSTSLTVTVPGGTFKNCVKTQERSSDGDVEYKVYAPGVGVVREMSANSDVKLISHKKRSRRR